VGRAIRAVFTVGHLAMETCALPPDDVVTVVQVLTLPSKLEEHSAALSPKLGPSCVPPFSRFMHNANS
jgi:hypothetical protein